MRKFGVMLLLVMLVSFSFAVAAVDEPTLAGDEQYETTKGIIGNYTPVDDEGQFDVGRLKAIGTKAEERIDAINNWLDENAGWFALVFGMVPEISWLFAFNLYIWLTLLVWLVLHSPIYVRKLVLLISKIFDKFKLNVFKLNISVGASYVVGIVLFLVVIMLKGTYFAGLGLVGLTSVWWGRLILFALLVSAGTIITRFMEWWGKDIRVEKTEREVKNVVKEVQGVREKEEERKEAKEDVEASISDKEIRADVDKIMEDMGDPLKEGEDEDPIKI